jgi:hypothetical protein
MCPELFFEFRYTGSERISVLYDYMVQRKKKLSSA